MSDADVIVVGAGLAGLAAAVELEAAGRDVLVLDADDAPGGRVQTDLVDGFRCDRGFQILLTAYPEAQRLLDLDALELCRFDPGAVVWADDAWHVVGDPLRRPTDLVASLRAPIGSVADKARILAFRRAVRQGTLAELWRRPETTARVRLERAGFSATMIERFFRPLFAGITLDAELAGSSRVLEFVFRMLAEGDAAVPAHGMGRIPDQLASRLARPVRYGARVDHVGAGEVGVAGGDAVRAPTVIVATPMSVAADLVGTDDRGWNGVTTVWLAADASPFDRPRIGLNGTGAGPISSVAVMSDVSPAYAPPGAALVAVSGVGTADDLADALCGQLAHWVPAAAGWDIVRIDRIPHAQPVQRQGAGDHHPAAIADGVFVAGDHRTDASINGALVSGARAAAAVLSVR